MSYVCAWQMPDHNRPNSIFRVIFIAPLVDLMYVAVTRSTDSHCKLRQKKRKSRSERDSEKEKELPMKKRLVCA